ncbi:hypothetical protein U5O48_004401 [Cronobacter turicensis]|nr:hypothetical protein [Cronobacter turicensis]
MITANRPFKSALQHYSDTVICPIAKGITPAQLDAKRILAAQELIAAAIKSGRSPEFALNLAEFAKSAPRKYPFKMTRLDAWRMMVDAMQAHKKGGAA